MLVLRPCVSSQGVAVSMREAAKPLLLEGFQLWKLEEVSHEMLVLMFPRGLVLSLWFSCCLAVSMGENAKPLLFECFQAGCHVVLRGRRGNLWHSNLFDNVSKVSKLEEVSHEMLVLLRPRVLSRVSGFPVGVAVSLGEAAQPLLFEGFQAGCHVVLKDRRGVLWHSNLFYTVSKILLCGWRRKALHTLHSELYTLHFPLHTLHSTLSTLHSTLYTLHSALLHSTLHHTLTLLAPHFTFHTPHFTLHTPHVPLHTSTLLHFTLHTPQFTL